MTDDGHAPTIPETQAPTHGPRGQGIPKPPDSRYAMRALLGKGGMGEVWLAHDLRVDRDIAIKLMRGGGSDNSEAVARFLREARVQGRLEHPSVVPVHDLGGDDSAPFFAMKRVTGTTIADVILRADHDKWPRRALLARFVDVCLAIEFAHQRGVIHRDLKPANVMLGDFGETYVLDWGLARISDTVESDVIRKSDLGGDSQVGQTEIGAMLGTPGYMPPEQMKGEAVDERADVFALGCILFEILAGEPAIARDRTLELTLTAPCYRPLERRSDVPPELDELCARATAADPVQRLASARELADGVQRFLDGDRDLARRRALAADHAKRAEQLLATDTTEARAEAMREAGSAIALDATNRDAQAVLGRLLLQPPKQIPPAARRAIDAERQGAIHTVLRNALMVYVVSLAVLPVVAVLGFVGTLPLVILAVEVALICVLLGAAAFFKWRIGPPLVFLFTGLHMTMVATIGVTLGPLLVLPILLFGSHPILMVAPTFRFPITVFVLHALAFVVPLTLEWLQVLPQSFVVAGNALVIHPAWVTMTPQSVVFLICAFIAIQLAGNTAILDAQRKAQDLAQEQLHLQKWQLQQLVPSSGSDA